GTHRIEREARALPVARTAELAKLVEDAFLVALLPAPDALDQLFAAEVVARLLLLLKDQPFHRRLRGDAGVIGAGPPLGGGPLHAWAADEQVLVGVVEGVAHVQGARDVRRRDDDGEGFACRIGPAVPVPALLPERQPLLLRLFGIVGLG